MSPAGERKLTPTKSEIEPDHTPAYKGYYDHLIKMQPFNKHPREYGHKAIEQQASVEFADNLFSETLRYVNLIRNE